MRETDAAPHANLSTPARARLAVIIINYGTPGLTLDCLATVQGQVDAERDQVIIVDNASPDDSVAQIRAAIERNGWEAWARLLEAPANGGFSAGNNVGLRACAADFYLLLNSDTRLHPGAVEALLSTLTAHPGVGLAGPRIEAPDGTPRVSCFRNKTPLGEFLVAARSRLLFRLFARHNHIIIDFEHPVEPDWISFACALVRYEVIDQLGLMDEGYFMYFEDVDYCRRARRAGWRIRYVPEARCVHLLSGSSNPDVMRTANHRLPRYVYAARARYFAKFYGKLGLWCANLLWSAGRAVSLAREVLRRKARHTNPYAGWDNWTNWWTPLSPD